MLVKSDTGRKLDEDDAHMGILRFRFSGDDDALASLLAAIGAAGVKTVTFREVPLSLEDAYMALSGIGSVDEQEDEMQIEAAADSQAPEGTGK